MNTTLTATLALLVGTAVPVAAQAVGQADVQIQSLTVAPARSRPLRPVSPRPPVRPIGGTTPVPGAIVAPDPGLSIQVVVFSNNDDDAQNVMLNIFLPPESRVLSLPAGCAAAPANSMASGAVSAFVTCALGNMAVNASRAVSLSISRPPAYVVPRVGVFAWSESPDPNTGNNHVEKVAP